jgi:glycosyltransferase involved in cell wall biosynthesis
MDQNTLISIIIPSRNNLKYLKSAYQSIRDNVKEKHDIILLDDASVDGTWEWMVEIAKTDKNVILYRNDGPTRMGHTVLYDIGAEMSMREVISIFHADMVASPNYIKNALKHLEKKTVVSMTRVEPPLHPSGKEKHVQYFGMEPEEFKLSDFLKWVDRQEGIDVEKTTEGIFAPWMIFCEDFKRIGGHDKKLFAPMELEDSDIFNRFQLAGYKFIQSRDSLVYHFTCRGSRFKDGLQIERVIDLPDGTKWHKPKDSEEYIKLRSIKFREWWRKWHTDVLHDEYLKPITHPRYDVEFNIQNCNVNLLGLLEPWCDSVCLSNSDIKKIYIEMEQPNTVFNLSKKIIENSIGTSSADIIISFDAAKFNRQDQYDFIRNLSQIISDSGEVGEFEYDIFRIQIKILFDRRFNLVRNSDFYAWKKLSSPENS